MNDFANLPANFLGWPSWNAVAEYWLDAWQRSILFLDALRERGNINKEHNARKVPHVLEFQYELIVDGRNLERPVNYGLIRIFRPAGAQISPEKHPIIVVDPRAGHGPGIGGMKSDSEIGAALQGGHPCYFVGFSPQPIPGQTVEDVCRAEAAFIETVAKRHPDAEGKPVIIANCQAGWQIMMTAAMQPDLPGPIILAGSPLSYWAGVRGKNPLRYLGGALGGTWLTALSGDLGNGIFDGAHLVANFEALNPANTLWTKPYNVYSKVDTEVQRFLEFETWWGSPVLLNAGEMQWITDNLFVGNKLATGKICSSADARVDLRNIKSPIIVFCSWGDNITPPQQALGWIADLYNDECEIILAGQTIVYTVHQSIGHLGIFVSGKIAVKEHKEFVSCIELIDSLPPGLYEAVITEVGEATKHPDLVNGRYLFRLETRTLNDIRALGGNDTADDTRFATAARVSEINLGLYKNFASPMLRSVVNEPMAEAWRAMHPTRLRFSIFSDDNPMMQPVKTLADSVRQERRSVSPDNPLLAAENAASSWMTACLKAYGEVRDLMMEAMFLATYGSPFLQALVGLRAGDAVSAQHIERDLFRELANAQLRVQLEHSFGEGGLLDAVMRSIIYVRLPEGAADERGFAMLKLIRESRPAGKRTTLAHFKQVVRQQFLLLSLDENRAIETLPKLLPPSNAERREAIEIIRRVVTAPGPLSEEGGRRLAMVERLFGAKSEPSRGKEEEVADA